MASRKARTNKRRRAKTRAQAADQTAATEEDPGERKLADAPQAGGKSPGKPKSRIAAAMDRMEQTADERPPAPWGSFPLGPLSVLAGLILMAVGAIGSNPVQLVIGVGLGMLGGLELSIREHFGGFRSHTTLLAGFVFVVAVGLTFYVAEMYLWQCLLIGVAIAVPTFWWLRKVFEKASGGLTYKLR